MSSGNTIQVSPDQVIDNTPQRRKKFFDALTAEPRTFDALRERTRRYAWFGELLAAYLRIIGDHLEVITEQKGVTLTDAQFLGFCNWMLLQGHEEIQTFLSSSGIAPPPLPSASAFWIRDV